MKTYEELVAARDAEYDRLDAAKRDRDATAYVIASVVAGGRRPTSTRVAQFREQAALVESLRDALNESTSDYHAALKEALQ